MAVDKKTVEATKEIKADVKTTSKVEAKAEVKKAPVAKKTTEKKAPAKKATVKKAPTKKPAKKEVVVKAFTIQSQDNKEVTYDQVISKVKKALKSDGKDLKIYVKSEEGKAYFTTADEIGSVDLF